MTDETVVTPFESPSKTDLKRRCRIAVESAGYAVRDELKVIPYPPDLGLHGGIKGDIQSDGPTKDIVHAYFIRPESIKTAPEWLQNIGRASRRLRTVLTFLVISEAPSKATIESCRMSGVGLLRLTDDDSFDQVVAALERAEVEASAGLVKRHRAARRQLDAKYELRHGALAERFANIAQLTRGMTDEQQRRYVEELEKEQDELNAWSEQLSVMLDEVLVSKSADDLSAVEDLIAENSNRHAKANG